MILVGYQGKDVAFRKVLIQKVDMDTSLTAYILGVSQNNQIEAIAGDASPQDLADPSVLCIEVGGSGQTFLNNFDHHDPDGPVETACEQAFALKGGDENLKRLVKYVSTIDSRGGVSEFEKTEPPYLSSVFSGMLLCTPDPIEQLLKGMNIFATALKKGIDPFSTVPLVEEWQEYLKAYEANMKRRDSVQAMVKLFTTKRGLKGGFVETDFFGAPGLIYGLGCNIAVVCHPRYGSPPVRKFTIAGNNVQVRSLLPVLERLEMGWGGPATGTILGSPRTGSHLTLEQVVELVKENL